MGKGSERHRSRLIGRSLGWLLVGLIGSLLIVSAAGIYVDYKVPVTVRPGGKVYTDSWDQGVVIADGTWAVENQELAFPVQFTKILCNRQQNTCRTATAEIAWNILTVDIDEFDIIRWTTDTITFTKAGLCVSHTHTISRAAKRVVGTRTPSQTQTGAGCMGLGKDIQQLSLMDGYKVTTDLANEARAEAAPFMWGGIAMLWMFVALRLLRRRASASQTLDAAA